MSMRFAFVECPKLCRLCRYTDNYVSILCICVTLICIDLSMPLARRKKEGKLVNFLLVEN